MQGRVPRADMRLIYLGGCDMVLGIQWLSQLGPVISRICGWSSSEKEEEWC